MKIYAATQKGINKDENEDRVIIGKSIIAEGTFSSEIDNDLLAIADGVGGNNAGAVASHFIANKLCDLEEISTDKFYDINEELLQLSKGKSTYNGMATTLSGVHIFPNGVCLFSVGNTRIYMLQSRKYLKQLTVDDTTLNYLLTTGQLDLKDAESFDRKNEITACFGGGKPELCKIKISEIGILNSPVMITSDGVHDYISVDQMEDIIQKLGISADTCEALITTARNNGSCDDMSVVLGDT